MASTDINSIQEFLQASDSQYKFIDMGRGLRELSASQLSDIEAQRSPAPYPRQQCMWLGCIFWNAQLAQQQYIWFIKLPLDERGLLNLAARNLFLEKVVEALGTQLQHTAQQQGQLGDNPYTFVPSQQQRADFNAKAKTLLGQAPSEGFNAVCDHLQSPQHQDWQLLSVQGVADYVARLSDPMLAATLQQQWPQLAANLQIAILNSMEHYHINKPLAVMVKQHYKQADVAANTAHISASIRALSQAPTSIASSVVEGLLQRPYLSEDVLILLAARHMGMISSVALACAFLEHCALHEDDLFNGLFADMVQLPQCRIYFLQAIQSPSLSQLCRNKIIALQQHNHTKPAQ